MKDSKFANLSTEQLQKTQSSQKIMLVFSILIVLVLVFFLAKDYLAGKEVDLALITVTICTTYLPLHFNQELKQTQEELAKR